MTPRSIYPSEAKNDYRHEKKKKKKSIVTLSNGY